MQFPPHLQIRGAALANDPYFADGGRWGVKQQKVSDRIILYGLILDLQ